MSSSEKSDFFKLGDKTSLICADANTAEVVKATLRELGFKFHVAETSEMAIEHLRYTNYDCIVVHENFAGSLVRSNSVLNYLAALPMAQRRYSFVCLVGPSFKTLDAMQDRKSTRLNSSHVAISYAVFCLKKKILKCQQENLYHKQNITHI